jgi:hypothetical protein
MMRMPGSGLCRFCGVLPWRRPRSEFEHIVSENIVFSPAWCELTLFVLREDGLAQQRDFALAIDDKQECGAC